MNANTCTSMFNAVWRYLVERYGDADIPFEAIDEAFIRWALHETNGNQSAAARKLGISRYALRYRMLKYSGVPAGLAGFTFRKADDAPSPATDTAARSPCRDERDS